MRNINSESFLVLLLAAASCNLTAKEKAKKPEPTPPQDRIVVDAHLNITQGPVTRFIVTKHYSSSYLYAECGPGRPVILIDTTTPAHPAILSELSESPGESVGNLVAAAGTAALAGSGAAASQAPPQTIRIMDFSDPSHPKVTRQFDGVTAIERSGSQIFLANPEGIWVLSEHLATDPAVEAEYARRVVYQ